MDIIDRIYCLVLSGIMTTIFRYKMLEMIEKQIGYGKKKKKKKLDHLVTWHKNATLPRW
jgi:hypothetical protein